MPALPASVLQEVAYSVNDDVMNKKNPTTIDRQEMPFSSVLNRRKKSSGQAGGSVTVKLKKNGGLDIQFWERRDPLGFGESTIDLELVYPFVNIHLGLELVHDDLFDSGYDIMPNAERNRSSFKRLSDDEANVLVDLVEEKIEDMYDSWDVKTDLAFHRDGSYDTKAIVGLDGLINTTPTTGTIGGVSRSNPKLQHHVATDLSAAAISSGGNIRARLNTAIRAANNNARGRGAKGKVDVLMCGDNFIDAVIQYAEVNNWEVQTQAKTGTPKLDIGIDDEGLSMNGISFVRNPTFKKLQELESASIDWNDRCYGLTSKVWDLVHPKTRDRIFSAPDDASDVRFTRFSIDGRYALVVEVPDANFLVALA